MRYRTKLTLLLVMLVVTTSSVLVGLSYWLTRDILVGEIQSKVLSIAATAAVAVDGDLHQQIKTPEDQHSEAYQKLEAQLRRVRNVNRRQDTFIRYIYTMAPQPVSKQYPQGAMFVVDAQEPGPPGNNLKSAVGDPIKYIGEDEDVNALDITQNQIDELFEDMFGEWLSANAPIKDATGRPVAALGVDMAAHDVLAKTQALLRGGLLAMSMALLMALGISLFLSRFVTRSLDQLSRTISRIGDGDLDARVHLQTKDEFGQLGEAVNQMAAALRDRELLMGMLARYLSYQVAEKIIRSGKMPELKGERRKVTVLFLDIRNFTQMADNMDPEAVVELLNQFFERMIDVIFKHKGTLDKFTGDGLMAFFGAPLDDNEQEYHAVCAALHMQQQLKELSRDWQSQGRHAVRIGMGINTGIAVVGNIGSTQRMDYTAIGDTVNLAARLEAATKEHNLDVLISEDTHRGLNHRLKSTHVGEIRVRGYAQPVSAYSVQGFCEPNGEA